MAPSKYYAVRDGREGAEGYQSQSAIPRSSSSRAVNTGPTHRLEFDGASKGNPGVAGCGGRIVEIGTEREVAEYRIPLQYGTTSNEAEYHGVIEGCKIALELGVTDLHVQGDSQLVIRQLNGEYRVSAPNLEPYYQAAMEELSQFNHYTVGYVPRESNRAADKLANEAVTQYYQQNSGYGATHRPGY